MTKNNFTRVFEKARSENRAALFIFVTGYHPNYETSKLIIKAILKYADAVEIGNPFNTSTADSSVIMNASEIAIAAGANTKNSKFSKRDKIGEQKLYFSMYGIFKLNLWLWNKKIC